MSREEAEILWSKLPDRELECSEVVKRILQFDPSAVKDLFKHRPFQRHQIVSIRELFPLNENKCGCGCGRELSKGMRRWASKECSDFAVGVRFVIAGSVATIANYLRIYYEWKCSECGCGNKGHDMGANGVVSWIKVDHIIPVKYGGGACWLSNYQLLCHDCHVLKTKKDFNWKLPLPSLFQEETQRKSSKK